MHLTGVVLKHRDSRIQKMATRKRWARKKTIGFFLYIDSVYKNKSKVKKSDLTKDLMAKYKLSERQACRIINKYNAEGQELIKQHYKKLGRPNPTEAAVEVAEVEKENPLLPAVITTTSERLPSTPQELKAYRYQKILSPEAQAMRIDTLVNACAVESGIARIKALELLDEITKEYSDNSNEEEPLFFDVFDSSKIKDMPEELKTEKKQEPKKKR